MGAIIKGILALLGLAVAIYFPLAIQKNMWPFEKAPQSLVNIEILLDHSESMNEWFGGQQRMAASAGAIETVFGEGLVAGSDNLAFRYTNPYRQSHGYANAYSASL